MPKKKETYNNLSELRKAVSALSPERRDIAERIIAEIEFLEKTLESLKSLITSEGAILGAVELDDLTVEYFGKAFPRRTGFLKENPALKVYNTTIQRYSLLFKQVTDMLPEVRQDQPTDPLAEFIKQGNP